jgi:hypothetical protein
MNPATAPQTGLHLVEDPDMFSPKMLFTVAETVMPGIKFEDFEVILKCDESLTALLVKELKKQMAASAKQREKEEQVRLATIASDLRRKLQPPAPKPPETFEQLSADDIARLARTAPKPNKLEQWMNERVEHAMAVRYVILQVFEELKQIANNTNTVFNEELREFKKRLREFIEAVNNIIARYGYNDPRSAPRADQSTLAQADLHIVNDAKYAWICHLPEDEPVRDGSIVVSKQSLAPAIEKLLRRVAFFQDALQVNSVERRAHSIAKKDGQTAQDRILTAALGLLEQNRPDEAYAYAKAIGLTPEELDKLYGQKKAKQCENEGKSFVDIGAVRDLNATVDAVLAARKKQKKGGQKKADKNKK